MPSPLRKRVSPRTGKVTWLVQVQAGVGPDGKACWITRSFESQHEAKGFLGQVQQQRQTGTLAAPTNLTFDHYLDRWLEEAAKPRLRPYTFNSYQWLLKKYVRPVLGGERLDRLTPLSIQGLYNSMSKNGLAPRTVRYTHAVLRNALKQAVRWHMIPLNPAESVDLPRRRTREMQAMSPEQATRFLAAVQDNPYAALFTLALFTGMRPSEYLALRWEDVDLARAVVMVRRSLSHTKAGWDFADTKTAKSRRSIPVPPAVVETLRHHKIHQQEQRLAMGPVWVDLGLVFTNPVGEPLDRLNLHRRHFRGILKAAGLPTTLRLYDLRHTCATMLLTAGIHPKIAQERLGHASITMTLDTYSHVLPDLQREATEKLEALLAKG
jgi:integrase